MRIIKARDPKTGRVLPRPVTAGEKYGRLTVLERVSGTRNIKCKCDCGNEKTVNVCNLRHKDPKRSIRSCGCLALEYRKGPRSNGLYIGGKKHPMLIIYDGMRSRCLNPKQPSYSAYGGRGIKICGRWLGPDGFKNFRADMGDRPSSEYSLDRIDVNGNYEPSNCRWATREIQNANRRPYTMISIEELKRLQKLAAKAEAMNDQD